MKRILLLILALILIQSQLTLAQECMEATSDEGVNVIGFLQPQAEYNFLGEDVLGESLDESSFYFNRARLGVVGNIPYDFSYYAMMEFSPTLGGPFLLDAFISYKRFDPYLKLTVGQFRTPFGIELSTPCHKLHTINRSLVVQNLGAPWRDMGLLISGGTGELSILGSNTENFLSYQFAILNGTGMNTMDDNRKKDVLGRLVFHPIELIKVGASYRFGKHPTQVTDAEDDERRRIGFDLELKYKDFLLQGEYINGSDKGSYTTGGGCGDPLELHQGSIDRDGYMIMAMYRTKWNIQPVIKYESYDPNLDLTSNEDPTQFIQNTITYGLNFFFNEKTRLQINYLYQAEETGKVEHKNDAILAQFQIAL